MKRLFLKLKISLQLWDEQTPSEQQTLAVPQEKPRKQASSKTKCTATTVKKKKKTNRARNPKQVQPRGTSIVTAPADLYSFSLQVESLGPIHKNSQQPLTQSHCSTILNDFKLYYSLEGLMLKLKLQYFGHLTRRTDSLEKTLMLGKIEGRRRG